MHRTTALAIVSVAVFLALSGPPARADETGTYYVVASTLNVRLAPGPQGRLSGSLQREQQVYVFETKDGWGRISKYYDGGKDGLSGMIARWVAMRYLSRTPPAAQ